MTPFSKSCKPSDTKHKCAFPLVEVRIYFQCFPGTHGSDAKRGIHDVDFRYETAAVADRGKTKADGAVVMKIHAGETRIRLTIFETTYQVILLPTIDPVTTLKGLQARLEMLGYNPGPIDGVLGRKTGVATLEFQADNLSSYPDGVPSPALETRIVALAGI